ncbi:MAG: hypothetical protein U0169_02910 [Polyangiaceae bacterium]
MMRAELRIARVRTTLRVHGPFDVERFVARFGPYVIADDGTSPTSVVSRARLDVRVEATGKVYATGVPHPGLRTWVTSTGTKFLRDDLALWVGDDGSADAWMRGPRSFPPLPHDVDAGILDTPLRVTTTLRLLASAEGVLAHGAGAVVRGMGVAFLGESGAGKSTTARSLPKDTILSDDQVGLFPGAAAGAGAVVASTPFVGMHGHVSPPREVPLAALVLLDRGRKGTFTDVPRARALPRMLASIPMLARTRAAASAAMDVATRLCDSVPVFEGSVDVAEGGTSFVDAILAAVGQKS